MLGTDFPTPLVLVYYVINMADGVGVVRVDTTIRYFDTFGMRPPQEIIDLGLPFAYSSSHHQSLNFVLCGYCLHFINMSVIDVGTSMT